MSAPKLAIHCITYNHEPYIRECLEGFVMQQTDFPFIAIVHDDASTDGTAAIVREYAAKYPDIITPIYETENKYSTGELGNIMLDAIKATGAEYVAYCEGDDYWTDPHKLQRQVDFLDSHPDFSMCYHNAYLRQGISKEPMKIRLSIESGEKDSAELYYNWGVTTASIISKTSVFENDTYIKSINIPRCPYGDVQIMLGSSLLGKIYYFDEPMCVYRITNSGANDYLSINSLRTIAASLRLAVLYGEPYLSICRHHTANKAFGAILHSKSSIKERIENTFIMFKYSGASILKHWAKACKPFILNGLSFKKGNLNNRHV